MSEGHGGRESPSLSHDRLSGDLHRDPHVAPAREVRQDPPHSILRAVAHNEVVQHLLLADVAGVDGVLRDDERRSDRLGPARVPQFRRGHVVVAVEHVRVGQRPDETPQRPVLREILLGHAGASGRVNGANHERPAVLNTDGSCGDVPEIQGPGAPVHPGDVPQPYRLVVIASEVPKGRGREVGPEAQDGPPRPGR